MNKTLDRPTANAARTCSRELRLRPSALLAGVIRRHLEERTVSVRRFPLAMRRECIGVFKGAVEGVAVLPWKISGQFDHTFEHVPVRGSPATRARPAL